MARTNTNSGGGGGSGTVTQISTSGSVAGGPITTSGTISLINDTATPGASMLYGTNSSGIRGWFAIPGVGALAQPAGQIVYGTGTSITSDDSHTIDPATGTMSFHSDDLGGDISDFALGGSGNSITTQHTATGAAASFNMFPDPVAFDLTTNDGAGLVSGISASTGNVLNILNNGLTWVWPTVDAAGVLTSDGSGNLSFQPAATALIGQTSGLISNPFPATSNFEAWYGYLAGNGVDPNLAPMSTFIGGGSGVNAFKAVNSTFLGQQSGNSAQNAANSIFIGFQSGENDTVDNTLSGHSILIGDASGTGGFSNSVAIGTNAINTSVNQFLVDAPSFPFTDIAFNSSSGTFRFGDLNGSAHSTTFILDDSSQTYTFNKPNITIDTVPYIFPNAQGSLNQALINDGTGRLNWEQVPITQGGQDQTGNTGSNTLVVLSITGTHTLQINPYLTVRAISAGTLIMSVNYTDETNISRSIVLTPQGLTSGVLNATGVYLFPATTICSNSATNVTVTVTFAGVSTIWDGGAYIIQLN